MTCRALLCSLACLAIFAAPASAAQPPDSTGPKIEVAFVLDATGSMGSWIAEARARVEGIAADLAAGAPTPDVRFALVSFRDRGDEYVTRVHPFSRDIEVMKRALNDTHARGGGDTPEAVIEALAVSIDDLKWSKEQGVVRLVYLVGDAPPKRYVDGPDEGKLMERALRKGIVVHSIICGRMGSVGRHFFERVARRSEGRSFSLAMGGRVRRSGESREAPSLAAAISSSAKAYSSAAGIDFSAARPVEVVSMGSGVFDTAETGLLGARGRAVRDAGTWSDLWAAHLSIGDSGAAPPPIDFTSYEVLVLGGADAGLDLLAIGDSADVRIASVQLASRGVRFFVIPRGPSAPVFQISEGGLR